VGVAWRTSSDVAVVDGVVAPVAVLGAAGSVKRATQGFVDRFAVGDGSFDLCRDEAELIVSGREDHAVVTVDGLDARLAAVVDRHGRRMALLTVAAVHAEPAVPQPSPLLEEPIDDSPAIIWLRDLGGHYLRVNRGYLEQLGTDAESTLGRRDAELTPAGSIEGMRLEDKEIAGSEPLELEYLIGAFEERPAFAALRFALRDGDGQATATCSVAAPVADAALARSECDRLMRIDRWGRLDAEAISQELLDEWGLTPADDVTGPPLDRDDRVAAALTERDEALATAASLADKMLENDEQRDGLRADLEVAVRRSDELDAAIATEQARGLKLAASLAQAEARVSELESERGRADEMAQSLEQAEARADALEEERARTLELEEILAARSSELESEQARGSDLEASLAARVKELESEQVRAGELEQSLARIEDQASGLESERAQRLASEASLSGAQTRTTELEEERAQADVRMNELEAEQARGQELAEALARAEARARELEAEQGQRQGLEQRFAAQARELAAEQTRGLELQSSLALAEAHAAELESAQARADVRMRELEAKQPRAQALAESLAQAEAHVNELESERAEEQDSDRLLARAEALAKELDCERSRALELRESLTRAEAHAEELEPQQTRRSELEQALACAEARTRELESELAAGLESEQARVRAHANELESQRTRGLELEASLARSEARTAELEGQLARITDLELALGRAEARTSELESERARAAALESLPHAEAPSSMLDDELSAVRGAGAQVEHAPPSTLAGPNGANVRWDIRSQRALSAALAGVKEWRGVLKQAIGTLGEEGGWDATVAWSVEKPHWSMRCVAFWASDPAGLATFETRTWQHAEDPTKAEFGRACKRMATTGLLDLESAEDPLFRATASEGIGSVLLVPVSDGGETIAMLGLLSRTAAAPDPELMASLDAVALQLGGMAQLLTFADKPRWRVGRA
jgi:PAS domain-containing protein